MDKINEHNELMDDVADDCVQVVVNMRKSGRVWFARSRIFVVYNCVCCGHCEDCSGASGLH